MIGLDSNILVQMAVDEHGQNSSTTRLFMEEIQRSEHVAVASLVVAEFLHVVTDARR